MDEQTQHVDTWEYRDSASATQHGTFCPLCGQECDSAALRGNLWHELTTFIASAVAASNGNVDVKRLFQQHEKRLSADVLAQINRRSTFRVQKHLLSKCVAAGIPLLRANGQPKGKTQLEREWAYVSVTGRIEANDTALKAHVAKGMVEALPDSVH